MSAQIKKIITTFFYIGYLPLIPGTFGSLAGLFIYIILLKSRYHLLIPLHSLIMFLGFLLVGKTAKLFGRKDPPQIVIDEINGLLVCFFALPPVNVDMFVIITGFIVFRILDSIKPYPANVLQHRWGSLGIMGDDIIAGIYTNLVLRVYLSIVK